MNLAELKIELIQKIIATDEVNLLIKINDFLDNSADFITEANEPTSIYEKIGTEEIYVFNEWQQKRIDIALQQVQNGEYISDEEAQKEIQAWLED